MCKGNWVVWLANDPIELTATEIILTTIGIWCGAAMMMSVRRRRGRMVVRRHALFMMMGERELGQGLGKRFDRAVNRRTRKDDQRECGREIF